MSDTFTRKFGGWLEAPARRWKNPDGSEGGIVAVSATIHPTAFIAPSAEVSPYASIGYGASIGESIGKGASIGECQAIRDFFVALDGTEK